MRERAARCAFAFAAAALVTIACTAVPDRGTTSSETRGTVAAAEGGHASSDVAAAGTSVVDFRERRLQRPSPPIEGRANGAGAAPVAADIVALVFGAGAPDDVAVIAVESGSFTRADAEQLLALLVRGGPRPTPAGEGSAIIAVIEPPPGDAFGTEPEVELYVPRVDYRALFATPDVDGDGLEELLLGRFAVHMGVYTIDADLLGLAGGRRELIARYTGVYRDACDAPALVGGAAADITASTLSLGHVGDASAEGGALQRIDHRLDCVTRDANGAER